MNFSPTDFFDIDAFAHRALLEKVQYVWEVIPLIASYLAELPLGKMEGEVDSRAYLIHPESITIGKGSVVEPGAYIKGPCVIGEDCEVRSGAYIRGNFIAGNGCVIGHTTEVKNALFLNHAKAGHFSYLGDSILGNRVNLGAGVKCANLRLDEKNIVFRYEGRKMDSKLRKLGAILGDDVHIGCNSVTNPGTFMGKKSLAYPCLSLQGFIPPGVTKKC